MSYSMNILIRVVLTLLFNIGRRSESRFRVFDVSLALLAVDKKAMGVQNHHIAPVQSLNLCKSIVRPTCCADCYQLEVINVIQGQDSRELLLLRWCKILRLQEIALQFCTYICMLVFVTNTVESGSILLRSSASKGHD
jgi:hypothetical protein